jgi:3-isopropylmalate dehydrogenase
VREWWLDIEVARFMTDQTYRIVAIPGDGVGPDVLAGARAVLDAAGVADGFAIDWTELLVGGAAIDAHGVAIRPADVVACAEADAVLLGAVGGPRWDDPSAAVRPEQALFTLRGGLGLFANLRPVTVHPALVAASPLRPELLAAVDLLIVRELTGGLYFGARSEATGAPGRRAASDTLPYAEGEIARVVRLAFDLAEGRRRRVTSVDKANVLATSRLWRRVADEIAAEHPDVALEHRLVDSCAMQLVRSPAIFDVIVTENLFGDILSDEAAVLAGSCSRRHRSASDGPPTASTACTSRSTARRRTSPGGISPTRSGRSCRGRCSCAGRSAARPPPRRSRRPSAGPSTTASGRPTCGRLRVLQPTVSSGSAPAG